MYYLANPPAATGDVVVSYSNNASNRAGVAAMVLDCVDTSAAPQVTGSGVDGTTISNSITPLEDASIIVDIMSNGTGSSMPSEDGDADTTHVAQDISGTANSSWGVSSLVQATAGSATFSWSVPSNPTSQILVAFAPSADAVGVEASNLANLSCPAGQFAMSTGTGWICSDGTAGEETIVDGGGGGVDLYQGNHADTDCDSSGGTVVSIESTFVCGFTRSNCPNGWGEFKGTDDAGLTYTITSNRNCSDSQCSGSCNTGQHTSWDDKQETCQYSNHMTYFTNGNPQSTCVPADCRSRIEEIACY